MAPSVVPATDQTFFSQRHTIFELPHTLECAGHRLTTFCRRTFTRGSGYLMAARSTHMWDGAPKQVGVTHWYGSGMSCQGCECCHQGSPAWMPLIPPIASPAKVTGRSASGARDYDELFGLHVFPGALPGLIKWCECKFADRPMTLGRALHQAHVSTQSCG